MRSPSLPDVAVTHPFIQRPEGVSRLPRVSFWTLGCRLNQHDTAAMRADLEAEGWRTVEPDAGSDWVIVNTCTVTSEADRQARQLVRRIHRERPDARIVVTGCYAQRAPRELSSLGGVATVLGLPERERLAASLARVEACAARTQVGPARARRPIESATPVRFGRTRALLKVQDGCDAFCSYCIVPYVRGRARSLTVDKACAQARRLLDAGFDELVVTGADLGSYGKDLADRPSLGTLVDRLLALGSTHRIRLSSIEPNKFDPAIVERLGADRRLCRHLHLPLQSGSASVLRAMRRPYTPAQYRNLVSTIASRGRIGIGADVMVGFPGEGRHEFAETRALLEDLPVTYLHVFRYSARPGTTAVRFESPAPGDPHVRARADELRALGDRKREIFYRSLVGETLEVTPESRTRDGAAIGMSDLYAPVRLTAAPCWRGIGPVRVTGADASALTGKPLPREPRVATVRCG